MRRGGVTLVMRLSRASSRLTEGDPVGFEHSLVSSGGGAAPRAPACGGALLASAPRREVELGDGRLVAFLEHPDLGEPRRSSTSTSTAPRSRSASTSATSSTPSVPSARRRSLGLRDANSRHSSSRRTTLMPSRSSCRCASSSPLRGLRHRVAFARRRVTRSPAAASPAPASRASPWVAYLPVAGEPFLGACDVP